MLTKGSKIKCKECMGGVIQPGEICEVLDISDIGAITFKFGQYHKGCMSYDEYVKYFEEYVEPKKEKREWTEWKPIGFTYIDLNGYTHLLEGMYRHNGMKVLVKYTDDEERIFKTKTSCYPEDTFELSKGLDLGLKRLTVKLHIDELKNYIKHI